MLCYVCMVVVYLCAYTCDDMYVCRVRLYMLSTDVCCICILCRYVMYVCMYVKYLCMLRMRVRCVGYVVCMHVCMLCRFWYVCMICMYVACVYMYV